MSIFSKISQVFAIGILLIGLPTHAYSLIGSCPPSENGVTVIADSNAQFLLLTGCDIVNVTGSGNKIVFGSITELNVSGENNEIGLDTAGTISTTGNGNKIDASSVQNFALASSNNNVNSEKIGRVTISGHRNTVAYGGKKPQLSVRGDDNKLVTNGTSTTANNSSNNTSAQSKPEKTGSSSANPSSILPAGLDSMWFIYNSNNGSKYAVMAFKDGTLTPDVNTVLKEGVNASKRTNPYKWATYSVSKDGEQLFVKFPNWKKMSKYHISDRSIKMNNDFKLTGCWQSISTSNSRLIGGVGSSTFSSNEFCFDKNGRFSNDSSFAIGGTGGGRSLGTAQGGKHGTYRISGN